MSANDNPFAASGTGGYDTRMSFGEGEAAAPQRELVKDTTTAAFATDVIQESRSQPVLVDFWAPWCGPCRQLTPVLERLVQESGGAVRLVKMNIDEHPSIAGQLGIQSIPAVIAFKDGKPVDGFMGAVPESQIREFIDRLGGEGRANEVEAALEQAALAREGGDDDVAGQIYAAVLEREPDNATALAGLAAILLDRNDIEGAKGLLESMQEAKETPELASVRARIALAEEVGALGDPQELARRLEADPNDHAARFDLALIDNARGERDKAADNLLHIVRKDRSWRDDAARNQLLQFFEAWGMNDETTLSARRRLSSLLFS